MNIKEMIDILSHWNGKFGKESNVQNSPCRYDSIPNRTWDRGTNTPTWNFYEFDYRLDPDMLAKQKEEREKNQYVSHFINTLKESFQTLSLNVFEKHFKNIENDYDLDKEHKKIIRDWKREIKKMKQ